MQEARILHSLSTWSSSEPGLIFQREVSLCWNTAKYLFRLLFILLSPIETDFWNGTNYSLEIETDMLVACIVIIYRQFD